MSVYLTIGKKVFYTLVSTTLGMVCIKLLKIILRAGNSIAKGFLYF